MSRQRHLAMSNLSSGDEGLYFVRRDEPDGLHLSCSSPPKPGRSREKTKRRELFAFFSWWQVSAVVGGIVFLVAFLIWTGGYVIREGHRQMGVLQPTPRVSNKSPVLHRVAPVTAAMLHVGSIVLGNPPLAVVNGKTVTEGSSLEVKTSAGIVVLRVVKIEDGIVHFDHDGQMIDARLPAQLGRHASPH
jgi:hypothetical protein